MNIFINNQQFELPERSTLADAAKVFGAQPPFALVLNEQFIPASEHTSTAIANHDRIDVISAIQGG